VEGHTVDGAEVTLDSPKLLFISSMEKPGGGAERRLHSTLASVRGCAQRHIAKETADCQGDILLPGLKLADPGRCGGDLHGLLSTSHHHLIGKKHKRQT
jgi:hypothetical protein